MAALFLSHSSQDDPLARAIEAWLRSNDITDVFIDYERSLGSAKWVESLGHQASACRVVLVLVTEAWLASPACFHEFLAAWSFGKRLVPLWLLSKPEGGVDRPQMSSQRLERLRREAEGHDGAVFLDDARDFDAGRDETLAAAIVRTLRAAGAQPGESPLAFEIDRAKHESPFMGLASYGDDDADAAVFFGREPEVHDLLQTLRAMRATHDRRALALIGPPGSGKTSLVNAGLLPRLRSEAPAWIPVRTFRPGRAPLKNFAEAVVATLEDAGLDETVERLYADLRTTWSEAPRDEDGLTVAGRQVLAARVSAEGERLREATGRTSATLLLAVDDAASLTKAGDEAEALVDYLRAAVAPEGNGHLLVTVGTERFAELQTHPRFQALTFRGVDVRPVPSAQFERVATEPARRYGVEVEPALVDALKGQTPAKQALPALSFTLQRQWKRQASEGRLTEAAYRARAEVGVAIERAAERTLAAGSADDGGAVDAVSEAGDRLGARTFVPALVGLDDRDAPVFRTARWSDIGPDGQALLERFVGVGLVVKLEDSVSLAHAAVFDQWPRMRTWLDQERERRRIIRDVREAAARWSDRGQDEELAHSGTRLRAAEALRDDARYSPHFTSTDKAYLESCAGDRRRLETPPRPRRSVLPVALSVLLAGTAGAFAATQAGLTPDDWRIDRTWLQAADALRGKDDSSTALPPAAEAALTPGDTFQECALGCPQMVVIPVGAFEMGDRRGLLKFARPVHTVTVTQAFALSRTEVTFEQWSACERAGFCRVATDGGFGKGRRPVINVTWTDAKQYARWLTEVTQRAYRLPTEAEWEYAARAGSTTLYWWGDQSGAARANCRDCRNSFGGSRTATVASFKRNPFGLYDVHGNVWEWVEDCWHDNYVGAPANGAAWMGDDKGDCTRAILRGGAWDFPPALMRAASRDARRREHKSDAIGFRVARPLLNR